MGWIVGNGIGVPFRMVGGSGTNWSSYWTTLTSGLIMYRKGIRNGNYVIDYSADGGVTWELNLVVLEPDEDTIIIQIDDGVEGYRHELRYDSYCIDVELTATGFNGIKGTDWENVFVIGYDYTVIKFGALYNWPAATDVRNICSAGWHVPSNTEYNILIAYLGGTINSAKKVKEEGIYWISNPDFIGTNEAKFNFRGSGGRFILGGAFANLRERGMLYTSTAVVPVPGSVYMAEINMSDEDFSLWQIPFATGLGIRPLKDYTTLTHGQTGTYTGNDGKVYRTICIGTQEWVADNLAETKYRDGSDIPIVTDDAAWAALATGAMCYYNNDINNALM